MSTLYLKADMGLAFSNNTAYIVWLNTIIMIKTGKIKAMKPKIYNSPKMMDVTNA
jgi:hypothetical protein